MTEPTANNYKDTLNLPKTNFDMKANLTQREPVMVEKWQTEKLYEKIRTSSHPKGKWILHDGPPYANGDIHMGHLLNKVLKDITIKFRTMQGHDSPYVPGWDCHGLPIESAIQKELGPKFRELTKEDVRKKCHDYAMKYVKLQGDSFQRLGILGEFQNPYLTLDHRYESGILDVLAELVQRDLVYRQKKPVHWCTNDRTALAEAELEYQNKKDTSIYVSFHMSSREDKWESIPDAWRKFLAQPATLSMPQNAAKFFSDRDLSLTIWTTTPWTLPANRAVAVNPDHKYVMVRYLSPNPIDYLHPTHLTIIAEQLVEKVMNLAAVTQFEKSDPITGTEFVQSKPQYQHPLGLVKLDEGFTLSCPVVLADYVTLEDGTGLVHTAPGHGKEDYQTGIKYGLEIYNPVLPDGKYDDTVPDFLKGKSIWDANQLVIDKLKENGTLFHAQVFDHEYPHCWRCKKPTIFRATEQWFVKATQGTSLLDNAKSFVNSVQFIPTWGKNRLDGMLDTRPDWCISRQRSWGVPIPAFFDAQGKCLLTEKSVRHIANYFKEHGADSWYTHTPAQLLGIDPTNQAEGLQSLGFPPDLDVTKFDKGLDILDVWFESGASHHAVLECTHPELGYPADMYLEGSDQHRGWFQSSLLEAAGYKSQPPFKQVLTHGFIVDEKGMKYSKSSGNYVPVDQLLKQHGADVLRLWVSSVDYQNDIRFGPSLIATISESYRKIRNTIRYLLGNLYDFNPAEHMIAWPAHSIDAWMGYRAATVFSETYAAYDTYEFHTTFKKIYEFCNVEISAIYAKAIKDRLYCELPDSPRRRASQSLCYQLVVKLVQFIAPILCFTAEEAWTAIDNLPQNPGSLKRSVHLSTIAAPPATLDFPTANHWQLLMGLIEKGNKQLDDLKKSAGLGNPLDAEALIILPNVADEVSALISAYAPEIEDALGVGFHRIEHGEIGGGWDIKIIDTREKYPSCARSWKRRPDVGSNPAYPDLSARDAQVVSTLRGK